MTVSLLRALKQFYSQIYLGALSLCREQGGCPGASVVSPGSLIFALCCFEAVLGQQKSAPPPSNIVGVCVVKAGKALHDTSGGLGEVENVLDFRMYFNHRDHHLFSRP